MAVKKQSGKKTKKAKKTIKPKKKKPMTGTIHPPFP